MYVHRKLEGQGKIRDPFMKESFSKKVMIVEGSLLKCLTVFVKVLLVKKVS